MVDMNIHEIQFVADHLTRDECRNLIAALHEKTFQLDRQKLDALKLRVHKSSCFELLLEYDRGIGRHKTFQDLALRLREIGKSNLADKLSKTIFHEEAMAIKKNFLDDPFKKMIPKDSAILDEELKITTLFPAFVEDVFWTSSMVWSVILGIVSGVIMLSLLFQYCCPAALPYICYQVCPTACSVRCAACRRGVNAWCKGLRKDIMKTVTGRKTSIDDDELYLI